MDLTQAFARVLTDTGSLTVLMIFSIPIVGIICGSITHIVKMVIRHRERMEMLRQGIDPDRSAEE